MELEEIVRKVIPGVDVRVDMLADGTITYSAEDDDGGICIWYREDDDGNPVIHLENIVSYRPGRGTEMMNSLIEVCRKGGYHHIELVVYPMGGRARMWQYQRLLNWYEHLGFAYEAEDDAEAAQFILSQPGEACVDDYSDLRHPRMVLYL